MEIKLNTLTKKDLDLLERIRKLRLADLADGMDALGLIDCGTMSTQMRPIRPGISFAGFAYTVQFQKAKRLVKVCETSEEYHIELNKWCSKTYEFFTPVKEGKLENFVIVMDMDKYPGGVWGSENGAGAMKNGIAGTVINGACRDTYECNIENIPVFCTTRTFNHVYGRLDLAGVNVPINCDGVGVSPMDIVCADDDGVLVIPYDIAEDILKFSEIILKKDQVTRSKHYQDLNMEADETLGNEQF